MLRKLVLLTPKSSACSHNWEILSSWATATPGTSTIVAVNTAIVKTVMMRFKGTTSSSGSNPTMVVTNFTLASSYKPVKGC